MFNHCTSLQEILVDVSNANYISEDGVLFTKDERKIIAYPAGKAENAFTIPDGVNSVADGVFYECNNLTSVTVQDSVTSIGNYAFRRCSNLSSVTIPESVIDIGDYAFCLCSSLTSVAIPNSVNYIAEGAFYECRSLTSVAIPVSVISIGDHAFFGCSELQDFYYNGTVSGRAEMTIGVHNSSLSDLIWFYDKLIVTRPCLKNKTPQ